MFNKNYIMVFLICIIITITGFSIINITNTKALSPLGNTGNNYEIVSNEFGKDFEKFIKDDSEIKIYNNKEKGPIIKIFNLELQIQKDNIFVKGIGYMITWAKDITNKGNFNKKENDTNVKEDKELDKAIESFIKSKEEKEKPKVDNQDSSENKNDENGDNNLNGN